MTSNLQKNHNGFTRNTLKQVEDAHTHTLDISGPFYIFSFQHIRSQDERGVHRPYLTSGKDFASDVMKNLFFHCEKSSRREGSDKFYKGFYSTWNSDEFWKIAFLVVFQYFLFLFG